MQKNVVFILQRLRRRTFTKFVIPGKTSAAGQMRSLRPDLVVPFHIVIGGRDPRPVILTRCFLRFMNGPPPRAKKPSLRARQIISAIGIQHRAMVVNLENKVVSKTKLSTIPRASSLRPSRNRPRMMN